jgi:hypothetical protein
MSNLIIPKNLIIYYPKVYDPSYVCCTVATSAQKEKIKRNARNSKYSDIEEIEVPNSNLSLKILANSYNFEIQISSPEIDALGFPVTIRVQTGNMVKLIAETPIIKFGELQGNYCLSCDYVDYAVCYFRVHLDCNTDERLKLAREAGIGLEAKKTSTWEPGHLYILSNKSMIIYLGELENIALSKSYHDEKEFSCAITSCLGIEPQIYRNNPPVMINRSKFFINLEGMDAINYKGRSLTEVLVSDFLTTKKGCSVFQVRDLEKSSVTGKDLGEYLTIDVPNFDVNLFLKTYSREELRNEPTPLPLALCPEYYKDVDNTLVKETIINFINKKKNNLLTNSTYYSSNRSNQKLTYDQVLKCSVYRDIIDPITSPNKNLFTYVFTKDELVNMINDTIKKFYNE